ncbi:MAG: rhomboid family intramembrane serine protease [Solobacterium sp.]|nr:rhomboid family intramembrane serine protease [Solobacterium sp.]
MKSTLKIKAPVTSTAAVVCVLVWLAMKLIPTHLSDIELGILFGAYYKAFISAGEWWRCFTCGFVHVSFMHLAVNMFSLYYLGRAMENSLGSPRFAAILFGSIIGGSLFLFCIAGNTAGVGISGGIYGLFAAYLYLVMESGAMKVPGVKGAVLQTLGINLLINFMPGVAWQSHLGGAITGILILMAVRKQSPDPLMKRNAVIALAIFVMLGGFAAVKRSAIGEEERYLRTDYNVLNAEKELGFADYAVHMAKKLDELYHITYLEDLLED